MKLAFRRAGSAALVIAVALASSAMLPALADNGRVILVQSDVQKRADLLMKGFTSGGGKAKFGAIEPGDGKEGLVVKDVELTSPDNKTVKIERIEVRSYDWETPEQPTRMDVSIRKLLVPEASLEKDVTDLGVTSLTINADIAYAFDDAKKAFEVSNVTIDVTELAEIKLKLKLAGIAAADLKNAIGGAKPGDDAGMKLLAQLSLVSASISFKDKSLTQRLIQADAKKKGISEAEAKKKMLEELAEQKKTAADDATKEVIDLAVKFLTAPGTIEVVASPSAPANVMATFMALMGSPGTLKQMLGLTMAVK